MSSNTFSNRRGLLSRPGVCAPPPPPPTIASLVFDHWDTAEPFAAASLHASYWRIDDPFYPNPSDSDWHFLANVDVLGVTLTNPATRTYEIEVNMTPGTGLCYIHATLEVSPEPPLHRSVFFEVTP